MVARRVLEEYYEGSLTAAGQGEKVPPSKKPRIVSLDSVTCISCLYELALHQQVSGSMVRRSDR